MEMENQSGDVTSEMKVTQSSGNEALKKNIETTLAQVILGSHVSAFQKFKARKKSIVNYSTSKLTDSTWTSDSDDEVTGSSYVSPSKDIETTSSFPEVIQSSCSLLSSRNCHYRRKRCRTQNQRCLPFPSRAGDLILSVKDSGPDHNFILQRNAELLGVNNSSEDVVDIPRKKLHVDKQLLSSSVRGTDSGLMGITMKTANLLKQNRLLHLELKQLKMDTVHLLQSVIKNPENQEIQESLIKSHES